MICRRTGGKIARQRGPWETGGSIWAKLRSFAYLRQSFLTPSTGCSIRRIATLDEQRLRRSFAPTSTLDYSADGGTTAPKEGKAPPERATSVRARALSSSIWLTSSSTV